MKRKNDTKQKDLEETLDKLFIESLLGLWSCVRLLLKGIMVAIVLVLLAPFIALASVLCMTKRGDFFDGFKFKR